MYLNDTWLSFVLSMYAFPFLHVVRRPRRPRRYKVWFITDAPEWLRCIERFHSMFLNNTVYTLVITLHILMALAEAPMGDGFARGAGWPVGLIMALNAVFITVHAAQSIFVWLLSS